MLHPYERLTHSEKTKYKLKVICILLVITALSAVLAYLLQSTLSLLLILLVLNSLAPFLDVPMGIKKGNLVRYSPMFITSKEVKNKIQLHGGTLFDYYFCLPQFNSASKRKKEVLLAYLNGLLNLIEQKESSPKLQVLGTTYILNPRTAKKLGFSVVKPQVGQKMILIFNYIPILIANSLLHKKIVFPNISSCIGLKAEIKDLARQKERILELTNRIKKADL